VRVQADLVYDTEPAYDYVMLQRRTSAQPEGFEYLTGGQGQYWTAGARWPWTTHSPTPGRAVAGTDIAVAFVFDLGRCLVGRRLPVADQRRARVDNITVTVNGTYTEDFEDG
jgi:hypothetical protein